MDEQPQPETHRALAQTALIGPNILNSGYCSQEVKSGTLRYRRDSPFLLKRPNDFISCQSVAPATIKNLTLVPNT